jgi:hypothetical protein
LVPSVHAALELRSSDQAAGAVDLGEQDPYGVRELAEDSLRLCDDGRSIYLPSASHWVHHDERERCREALSSIITCRQTIYHIVDEPATLRAAGARDLTIVLSLKRRPAERMTYCPQ